MEKDPRYEMLIERLDALLALQGCALRGERDLSRLVEALDLAGVSSPTIAKALGVKPVTIRTTLFRLRKSGKKKTKAKK